MASFTRTYSDQDLWGILEKVVESIDQEGKISQSTYDKAREESGYAHTPRAKYIAKRLGKSWDSLVAKAQQANRQAATEGGTKASGGPTESASASRAPSTLISHTTVQYALRLIADRLGGGKMNAMQYERERQKLLALATDKDEHYMLQESLPSAQGLQRVFGSWAEVCKVAGLEGEAKSTKTLRTPAGSYDLEDCKQAISEALEWAAGAGVNLTQRAYQQYAVGQEGVPSLRAIQDILKKADMGSFADLRKTVQVERICTSHGVERVQAVSRKHS